MSDSVDMAVKCEAARMHLNAVIKRHENKLSIRAIRDLNAVCRQMESPESRENWDRTLILCRLAADMLRGELLR